MSQDSVHVGTFSSHRADGRPVPEKIVGLHIWYSRSKGYFISVDEDKNVITSFGFNRFKKYVDAGVVSYMTPGVEQTMMELLDDAVADGRAESDDWVPGFKGKKGRKGDGGGGAPERLLRTRGGTAHEPDPATGAEPGPVYGDDAMEQDVYHDQYDDAPGYAEHARARADAKEKSSRPPKDPTRHIGWFFGVTFVISAGIAAAMVFLPDIMRLASNIF